ncbi:putative hAT family C-terminal dimerization region-containing protein 20 [Homarus americanus]|uniref:Putative hAT family C-terminal dimerization region-containing protein 20 n=1 Tax=Homarus americanus TaxID=6706 RepID=A0A8J5NBR6_HOMAM|nr:putative hAT family C-terminal dimerization region-containing protein 20 [Homarus americanus]
MGPKDQEELRESFELTKSLQKRPLLFSFMPPSTKSEHKSHTDKFEQVLMEYIGEDCVPFDVDPLVFWKDSLPKMHSLKHLAREMLGCTSTSAPSGRVFSVAGNFSPLTERSEELQPSGNFC